MCIVLNVRCNCITFLCRSFGLLSGKNSIEDVLTLFPSTEDGLSFFVEIAGREQMTTQKEIRDWYEDFDKTIYYIKQLSFVETSSSFCTASLNMIKKRGKNRFLNDKLVSRLLKMVSPINLIAAEPIFN